MTRTRSRSRRHHVVCVMLVTSLLSAQMAQAQVNLSFSNVDISQVAKAIGAATDTTIIVDPRVKGQLNLVSDNPVSKERALKSLEAALRMQGFALVRDNGILKVVPEADAKLQGVPTYVGNTPQAHGDNVITQVFRLRNESATNLMPVLRPLITPNNAISAYANDNTLVVTDYADNVRRIAAIIVGIDSGSSQKIAVVPLNHESAVDLAPIVQKMLDPNGIGNTDATLKVSVTADPRINALLLRASDPSRIKDAKAFIAELDAPTRVPGNMHVVRLQNASAVDLAKVLRGMLGQSGGTGSDSDKSGAQSFGQGNGGIGGSSGTSSSTGTPGLPPLPSGTSGSGGLGGSGSGSGASGSQGGLIASARGGDNENGAGGMIQADPATNSLVITAPEPAYQNIRNVIDQLDARRSQVYLEAMIVEMSATSAANIGVQWQGALQSSNGNNALVGGTNFATSTSQGIVNLTAQGQTIGQNLSAAATTTLLNNGVNIGLIHNFGKFFGLGALVQALATSSNANILSSPNLITLDNEEAKIVVGSNVPVVTGSYATPTANTSTGVNAFNTFDRQDVGIVLHVKPQITKGGVIKMQIYSEDSSVDPTSTNNPGGVTIIKRSVQSTVLSDDGEIIVLGGLIQDNYSDGNNKVPLLGDLPLIGSLFRAENKNRTKTNVMVFLRPVIVRDSGTSASIAENRYDHLRQQTSDFQSDNRIESDHDIPILPPVSPGPRQGVPAAQSMFDLNRMTRPDPASATPGAEGGDNGVSGVLPAGNGGSGGAGAIPANLPPAQPTAPVADSSQPAGPGRQQP
ncbi:general secretion pathway protein GspD [Caballeronia mineralivorans PML1(12)]|uniref:General secretion pathway protein GspD n=1 Tax=Caballeronia mineralivorans PML1(12) TaxID=908627 RepID=A0A0J1CWB5_9BURK|nr:type II secretion system secretin GspD [Caballeronia mineralivorans]KLU24870.1 general secretion pathway protein GspD [Caballeronia mineralivorans PML1(12)]